MADVFQRYQAALRQFIQEYLTIQAQSFEHHAWSRPVFDRLLTFVPSGKLMRGSLVLLAYEGLSADNNQLATNQEALKLATAIELFQSGVLIHDDIIDRDAMRRGQPSIPAQFQQVAAQRRWRDSDHIGLGLAICAGDIALFTASQVLAEVKTNADSLAAIQKLFYQEVINTGFAEMADVELSLTEEPVTEADVLNVYEYKTSHYSLLLPLGMGGLLAQRKNWVAEVAPLALTLGLAFQIKDDELGLFGSEAETGKPVTSDAREGKKTLYYVYFLAQASDDQKREFLSLWGKSDLREQELGQIHELMTITGVKDQVADKLNELKEEALQQIEQLPAEFHHQTALHELVRFSFDRRH